MAAHRSNDGAKPTKPPSTASGGLPGLDNDDAAARPASTRSVGTCGNDDVEAPLETIATKKRMNVPTSDSSSSSSSKSQSHGDDEAEIAATGGGTRTRRRDCIDATNVRRRGRSRRSRR